MKNESSISKVLPVLFGFFIMGFVDAVGISTNYVKQDFNLSDTLVNIIPVMVFLWFAVFSVPTGLLMNKLGRKNTVLLSMLVTLVAMLIPVISYRFSTVLLAFALLGIGNTILQVSLNPLVANVVSGEKFTSSLTLGQFVKAISSFLGPIIAGVASVSFGNWKLMFPIFGGIIVLSSLWLILTNIPREQSVIETSSFSACFGLLKDKVILMLFLGIIFIVGLDVGLNITIPKFIMERVDIPLEKAGYGTSLYFAARTIGTFLGSILLLRVSGRKFYIYSMLIAIASMAIMLVMSNLWAILILVFIIGLTLASIFAIIFSAALKRMPERANEISGLMIMGVAGGGIMPPLMGVAADSFGQTGGMALLLIAMFYLLYNSFKIEKA